MTIYIHSAPDNAWYEDLVGKMITDVWIGYTGHYHIYESIFAHRNPEVDIGILFIHFEDAMEIR